MILHQPLVDHLQGWISNIPEGRLIYSSDAIGMGDARRLADCIQASQVPPDSLVLRSLGGELQEAAHMSRVIHELCPDVESRISFSASSSGLLIAMACRRVIMGVRSFLGPIDPEIRFPVGDKVGASYEDLRAVAKLVEHSDAADPEFKEISDSLSFVSRSVPLLTVGALIRSRNEVLSLTGKALENSGYSAREIASIVELFVRNDGLHDHRFLADEVESSPLRVDRDEDRVNVSGSALDSLFIGLDDSQFLLLSTIAARGLGWFKVFDKSNEEMAWVCHAG